MKMGEMGFFGVVGDGRVGVVVVVAAAAIAGH
jgi:hypothetical protein